MKHLTSLTTAVLLLLSASAVRGAVTTNALTFGHITPGAITAPAQTNCYSFIAASNDVVAITLLRTNGVGTTRLYLYDPMGVLIYNSAGSGALVHDGDVRLVKTGTYAICIVEDGLNGTYSYLLRVSQVACGVNEQEAGDGPETLVAGQISGGTLTGADYDTYCFTASSNDVLYLTMLRTNGPGTYPYFYLYDPDGVVLPAPGQNDYLAHIPNRRLTKSGVYTVGVIDNGLNESFGYSVCMIKVPGPNFPETGEGSETLRPGELRAAQITRGDCDAFAFTGHRWR